MNTRQLGNDGPYLSEIGLGAWAIGGPWIYGWGQQDDNHSIDTIRRALDKGVNWVDTAPVYGLGHGEEVVGRALKNRRGNVFIATKCGLTWDDNGRTDRNGRPDSIRRECDDSLRRLQVDHIDLYQVHWPDAGVPIEDTWGEMVRLKESGKIRFIGLSNADLTLMRRCQAIAPVQSLQPPYSLVRRDGEDELLPWCRENGVGVLAYSPMQCGLLTGKFSHDYLSSLAPDDWRTRHKNPYFREPLFSNILRFVEQLKPIADAYGKTRAQLAIAWVLGNPALTAAIVGARSADQVNGVIPGAGWAISEDDIGEIDRLYQETVGD